MARVLDIVQDFLAYREIEYERLDGSVRGHDRSAAVDAFNRRNGASVFLLSTRAGGVGLTAGGYGHDDEHYSDTNVFASNVASGNGFAWDPMHGAARANYWTDNVMLGGGAEWRRVPEANANVSIFEP